jgi:GNAT superfamily N-acetyltransferase
MSHLPKRAKDQANIEVLSFTGPEVNDWIPQIARLRVEVFPEYPFLYVGNYEYEMRYLEKFLVMKNAIVIAAFDKDELIGISTGFPFIYESDNLKEVLVSAHRNPKDYFCFGESVLRKSYRSLGIGKTFFDRRERHVQSLGQYQYICFYTIVRPAKDPRRPSDYRPLAPFWQSRGYTEHPELIGTISYQEIGEAEETPKEMVFWIKELEKKPRRD